MAHARVSPARPLLEAEYRIRRPDGTVHWLYERGTVEFDAAGVPVSRAGMVMDVTERKRLEHSSRQLSQTLTATLEGLSDAFFTVDNQWRFTYVNPEAKRITQKHRSEPSAAVSGISFPRQKGPPSSGNTTVLLLIV